MGYFRRRYGWKVFVVGTTLIGKDGEGKTKTLQSLLGFRTRPDLILQENVLLTAGLDLALLPGKAR